MLETGENKSIPQIDSNYGFRNVVLNLDFEDLENHLNVRSFKVSKREAIESLACLTFKLKDELVNYDTVLIDDASGRLVGLYLLEQIKIKKTEEGKSRKVMAYGVASGNNVFSGQEDAVRKFIRDKKDSFGRVLVVTEHIRHGNGIMPLAESLAREGVDFGIATVSAEDTFIDSNNSRYSDERWKWLKDKVVYGNKGKGGLFFYHALESGMMKIQPSKNKFLAHAQKNPATDKSVINETRRDMGYLARNILEVM